MRTAPPFFFPFFFFFFFSLLSFRSGSRAVSGGKSWHVHEPTIERVSEREKERERERSLRAGGKKTLVSISQDTRQPR